MQERRFAILASVRRFTENESGTENGSEDRRFIDRKYGIFPILPENVSSSGA